MKQRKKNEENNQAKLPLALRLLLLRLSSKEREKIRKVYTKNDYIRALNHRCAMRSTLVCLYPVWIITEGKSDFLKIQ